MENNSVVQGTPENPPAIPQDLILIKDVNYFGRTIKKGSTFKKLQHSEDWYVLWENNRGILMHCPAIKIHFTSITEEYFIKQWECAKSNNNEAPLTIDNSRSIKCLCSLVKHYGVKKVWHTHVNVDCPFHGHLVKE